MAGHSDTPLIKKLGIKEGHGVSFVNAPKGFRKELGKLPVNVVVISHGGEPLDFILLFSKSESSLRREFPILAQRLKANGMLWVSWPKKSSNIETNLRFENVQRIGLDAGLVDVKICAIDDTWSGLKFVFRLRDRHLISESP
jgi:hypothetical protein